MRSVEVVVIGQGLAGTTLAWSLYRRQWSAVIVEKNFMNSSSHIAAGLATPITGRRLVPCWEWSTAKAHADRSYRLAESLTASKFWYTQTALRLFASADEQAQFSRREETAATLMMPYAERDWGADGQRFDNTWGGFQMPDAARLETAKYLEVSRDFFEKQGWYYRAAIDSHRDLEVDDHGFTFPTLGLRSRWLILAEGFQPAPHPWFPSLPLAPCQGDILTLRIPQLHEQRVLHRGVWLTPCSPDEGAGSDTYLAGSTYLWDRCDGVVRAEQRERLLDRLRAFLRVPIEILDHRTAVRPTSFDQKPLLGPSPRHPRLWICNGLGSKGALYGPWMAEWLLDAMQQRSAIPPALRWDRRGAASAAVPGETR
jgi:glycine/D-amino acid oxidase-like deaminating enzyme